MFTGIIEDVGIIKQLRREGTNLHLTLKSNITNELKIDQSLSHNGVCLTVINIKDNAYTVTAIDETLNKTTIGLLTINEHVNLERALKMNGRLDGHLVQGHIDQTATCINAEEVSGSWLFTFKFEQKPNFTIIDKGSVTINGVSLTVANVKNNEFTVAIIPYTYKHTNFNSIKKESVVNIEFDMIGKYLEKLYKQSL